MAQTRYEVAYNVAVVTISNPPVNLFTWEVMSGIAGHVQQAAADHVRAFVLQADGDHFSAGADVSLFKGLSAADGRCRINEGITLIASLEEAPFPTICAVHGICYAGGLELALACDLVVAADNAQFAQVEQFIGAATFLGGVQRLAERAGPARAREITFSGYTYSAETFERWNIINRVVPAKVVHTEALKWAVQLAKGPTMAHNVTKRLVRSYLDDGVRSADRTLLDVSSPLFDSGDLQNAVDLLLKRGPREFRKNHHEVVFEGK